MAHPRMYADDDPYLADLRDLCLALPEATEVEAWGRPTFRAGKIFAMYNGDDEHAVLRDVQARARRASGARR